MQKYNALFRPESAPTAPNDCERPSIKDASHSTLPSKVKLEPYPMRLISAGPTIAHQKGTCVEYTIILQNANRHLYSVEGCAIRVLEDLDSFGARSTGS